MAPDADPTGTTGIVDGHPVASFFALAIGFSWSAWIPVLSALEGHPAARFAAVPGAFGPAVAAAAVTRLRGESVRAWLADAADWRRSPRWYAAAVGVPVGVSALVGVAVLALSGGPEPGAVRPALALVPVNLVFATLLGGGQEEFGWRGFALPHLQARYDALTASVAIGVVWAAWHAPLFALGVYALSPVPYAAAVVAFSVLLTWLYNGSRGCLPAAVLAHGAINAAVNVPVQVVGGRGALPVPFTALLAVGFGAVAVLLVVRYGRGTLADGPARGPTWPATDPAEGPTTDATAGVSGVSAARRWTPAVTSFVLVALTATVALAAAPRLPDPMVVGWHLGLDGTVTVTRGPRAVGLAVLPAVSAVLYAVGRLLVHVAPLPTRRGRLGFEAALHLTLGSLCALQAWVVAANL